MKDLISVLEDILQWEQDTLGQDTNPDKKKWIEALAQAIEILKRIDERKIVKAIYNAHYLWLEKKTKAKNIIQWYATYLYNYLRKEE